MTPTKECMKKVSVECLNSAWIHLAKSSDTLKNPLNQYFMAHTYFAPANDKYRQTWRIRSNQLIAGLIKRYDVIGADGELELDVFVPESINSNPKQVQNAARYKYLNGGYAQALDKSELAQLFVDIITDQNFKAPVAEEAMLYARKNHSVYAYGFNHESDQLMSLSRRHGVIGSGTTWSSTLPR